MKLKTPFKLKFKIILVVIFFTFLGCSSKEIPGVSAADCYYRMVETGVECTDLDSAFKANRPDFMNEINQMTSVLGPLKSRKLVSYSELESPPESVVKGKYGILNYECRYEKDNTRETVLFIIRTETQKPTILNVTVDPYKLRL
jgi:hypothetical protein